MSTPPRTVVFHFNGMQFMAELPPSLEKAIALVTTSFGVPSTHGVRLSCNGADMAYPVGFDEIVDDTSYHYASAGKQSVPLNVHVYEKNPGSGSGSGDKGETEKKEEKKEEPPKIVTATYDLSCVTTAGKTLEVTGSVTGELGKGPSAGTYVGAMRVSDSAHSFIGKQLGPNEELTKIVVADAGVVRLLFRPRSMRSNIDIFAPEYRSLEVHVSLKGWEVTANYPMAEIHDDKDSGRKYMRWFLRVQSGGLVQDLMTGTEAGGIFYELLPTTNKRPPGTVDPMGPLNPSYPDIRPSNGWCLSRDHFLPHIDRVLTTLGLPAESRSSMITGWLPSVSRHTNIAYRILHKSQLDPTSEIHLCPEPDIFIRIFILFRGVPDSEVKEWNNRTISNTEMGTDWREAVGHSPAVSDDGYFRVIEYGGMEVFDY